ncbi:unnamed protein product [Colias eurytheme]|nr:unnamed protein product [Colias eurytheme]
MNGRAARCPPPPPPAPAARARLPPARAAPSRATRAPCDVTIALLIIASRLERNALQYIWLTYKNYVRRCRSEPRAASRAVCGAHCTVYGR